MPVAAVVEVAPPVPIAGIEAQVEREAVDVRGERHERRGPIAAARAATVELTVLTITRRRQEYTVAVCLARETVAIYTVYACPFSCGVIAVDKFLCLVRRGHAPARAPVHVCSIVFKVKFCLVIYGAEAAAGDVLRQRNG